MINIYNWSLFCILDNYLDIKKATILVTNKCNFKCEHCFWGKPENEKVITTIMLRNIVNKCAENNIRHICFSGGEPVLYLEKIIDVMKLYRNRFLNVSICTNGYWGNDATEISKKFKIAGINNIELSYDAYHAKFVSFEKIENIIAEARKNNIAVRVVVSVANSREIVQFQSKLIKHIDNKYIIYQYVGRYGNGKDIEIDKDINGNAECVQFMNQICVDFNGLLYYCCGPYVALGRDTNFCVGEFNQERIDKLKNNIDLFKYMNSINCTNGTYMCEECLKRLDNYILSKEICRCNN